MAGRPHQDQTGDLLSRSTFLWKENRNFFEFTVISIRKKNKDKRPWRILEESYPVRFTFLHISTECKPQAAECQERASDQWGWTKCLWHEFATSKWQKKMICEAAQGTFAGDSIERNRKSIAPQIVLVAVRPVIMKNFLPRGKFLSTPYFLEEPKIVGVGRWC